MMLEIVGGESGKQQSRKHESKVSLTNWLITLAKALALSVSVSPLY